jgi:predicted metal-dependent phosphoesterase TrpH
MIAKGLPELHWSSSERADLHLHSCFSDGQHTPSRLAQLAAQKGLSVIALTDHATVEGITEMIVQAASWGVYNIPAIELNARTGDFLGYFIDYEHKGLLAFLEEMNVFREKRIRETVARLNELGHWIDWPALVRFARPALPSRSHIARMFVALGRFPNVDTVFKTLLGRGRPAYIEPEAPSDEQCIQMIREAGGLAVLAHPQFLNMALRDIQPYAYQLASWGLSGYERIPESAGVSQVASAWGKAGEENGLFEVGGSGFHGEEISGASLGGVTIGGDLFPKMKACLPDQTIQKSFFKRMFWRSSNLSSEEFRQSLFPEDIQLKTQTCVELLDYQPALEPLPVDFTGLPFVLIGPGALDRHQEIAKILQGFGAQIVSEEIRENYPALTWALYRMYQLPRHLKHRDLLRFALDHHLYGERAASYRIIFFHNPRGESLRRIKQQIRGTLGKIKFYRVTCQNMTDTFFTSYVHIPDEEDINWECWVLQQAGSLVSLALPATTPVT